MDINIPINFDEIKLKWTEHFIEIKKNNISNLITLQIHIPFCPQNCNFCNCSLIDIGNEKINDYMKLLERQIYFYKDIFKYVKINHVFISWGSPSFIWVLNISKIFRLLYDNFLITEESIIWYEVDPIFTTEEILKEISKYTWKITCEIWVQTTNKKVLQNIERYQSNNQIIKIVKLIRKYKLLLCTDIILWLPWENLNSFKKTLDFVVNLWSDAINAFVLELSWNDLEKKYSYKFNSVNYINIGLMNNYLNNYFIDKWILKSEVIVWYWGDNYKHKTFFPNEEVFHDNLWREKWSVLSLWYWDKSIILWKLIYTLNNDSLDIWVEKYSSTHIDLYYSMKKYFLINFASYIDVNIFFDIFKRDIFIELKRELDILIKYNKVIIENNKIIFNFKSVDESILFQRLLFKLTDKVWKK